MQPAHRNLLGRECDDVRAAGHRAHSLDEPQVDQSSPGQADELRKGSSRASRSLRRYVMMCRCPATVVSRSNSPCATTDAICSGGNDDVVPVPDRDAKEIPAGRDSDERGGRRGQTLGLTWVVIGMLESVLGTRQCATQTDRVDGLEQVIDRIYLERPDGVLVIGRHKCDEWHRRLVEQSDDAQPIDFGICKSRRARSGCTRSMRATASMPVDASPRSSTLGFDRTSDARNARAGR